MICHFTGIVCLHLTLPQNKFTYPPFNLLNLSSICAAGMYVARIPVCILQLIVIWINTIWRKRLVTDSYKTSRNFLVYIYGSCLTGKAKWNFCLTRVWWHLVPTKMPPLISSRIIAICLRSKILLDLYTG